MSIDDIGDRPAYAITVDELLSRHFSGLAGADHTKRAIAGLCDALAPQGTFQAGDEAALLAHLDAVLAAYKARRLDQDKVMAAAIALAESAYNGDRASMIVDYGSSSLPV